MYSDVTLHMALLKVSKLYRFQPRMFFAPHTDNGDKKVFANLYILIILVFYELCMSSSI
jgi:hypothetical protein